DVPANNLHVCWAKDGTVYLLTNQGSEYLNLAQMDIDTGQITYLLADLSWDVEDLALAPDGHTLAYTTNVDGYKHLSLYDLDTGKIQPIPDLPSGVVSEPVFSTQGTQLAISVQSPQDNFNIWLVDLEDALPSSQKLTQSSLAGIPKTSLVSPEIIHYDTFDGRSIPGFFYQPSQGEAPYPCILYVHGGPASQIIADFDPRFQFFLNNGYAILAPNVRGSAGYGKTYKALDDVELRMDSVADLKYAVEWLRGCGVIDPDRIAIYGRSYGGFMVLSAVTTYPELWAAAIDVVGIANWVTFLENTGVWRRANREKEYGSLENNREFLEKISPIHKVDQIQCPMIVLHGANDPRVPVTEADQIVTSLQERGHPVEYLRYEDEGHKIAKLSNRIDSFTKMADFLARYL
ncbi:MAG: S9 family peptidase, partial [Anaerolineaceae bacterium]|nr:S9 family peptidase [Anaerolineaceae bacterium]